MRRLRPRCVRWSLVLRRRFSQRIDSPPIRFVSPARHVYWANRTNGTIGRADIGGQNADQSFITGADGPTGVAVDSGHIYWNNLNGGAIGRADLDGQNANQSFITGGTFPEGVAVDAGHVY
jgi:virginiamycin B lyase